MNTSEGGHILDSNFTFSSLNLAADSRYGVLG